MPKSVLQSSATSLPISERIVINVFETISSIQRANGYAQTLDVERLIEPHNEPADLKAVIVPGDHSPVPNSPHQFQDWDFPIDIVVWVVEPEESARKPGSRSNQVAADICKALKIDRNRNDLAINTTINGIDFATNVVQVRTNIFYRTLIGNPYSR